MLKKNKTKKDEHLNLAKEEVRKEEENRTNTIKQKKQNFIENYKSNPYETMRDYLLELLHPDDCFFTNEDVIKRLIKIEELINLEIAFKDKGQKPKL